jgi:hypothetical protein
MPFREVIRTIVLPLQPLLFRDSYERPNIQITYQPLGRSAAVTEHNFTLLHYYLGSPLLAQAKMLTKVLIPSPLVVVNGK